MLRDYLKKTNIKNFPDNEIESIINDYLTMSNDTNLKRVTDKLDKINLVMPVKFENDEIKEIVLSESDDHNLYMTLFTSINEYEKYEKEETGYMVDTLANIASILTKPGNKAQGLIIDPYGINLMLSKDVIVFKNTELYKSFDKEINYDDNIIYGIPKNNPEELINNLKELFKNLYYVNKAYLSLYKSSDDYHYLLIIDMPPLENMFIYSDIQMEVSKYSLLPIQVLIKDDNELVSKVINDIKPFYEKVDIENK